MSDYNNLFDQINNAVLDLQSAEYATYQRPLKKLASLLNHADLIEANQALTTGLNLDKYLSSSASSNEGFALPTETEEYLGITLLLIEQFAEKPNFMENFGYTLSRKPQIMAGIELVTSQIIIPFVRDYKAYILSQGNIKPQLVLPTSNKVFIVHGHDEAALQGLARFIEKLKLEAIILKELPNQGRTIIEKYEDSAAEVGFAVILLTPDDLGSAVSSETISKRARQNVIFELGYFAGKLGRGRVCLLRKGDVEIPSDLFGVVYTEMDNANAWKYALAQEFKAAGINFNPSLLLQ